jgi:hypothetical protein
VGSRALNNQTPLRAVLVNILTPDFENIDCFLLDVGDFSVSNCL